MKTSILLLVLTSSLVATLPSCKKDDSATPPITQTYNVNLRTGESYTFTLPDNSNAPYHITTPAAHASVSELYVSTSGDHVYKYTPATGYSGTDQVIVSNDPESNQTCTSPQGPPPGAPPRHCPNDEENHYIITLNFTMADSVTMVNK